MSSKRIEWNGKLGGSHTTVIDAANRFVSTLARENSITKISPGYIVAGKSPSRSTLKIIEERGSILLSIRGSLAHQ